MTTESTRSTATSERGPITRSEAAPETFCTSGTSPTVHLCGCGQVGRELLDLIAGSRLRLVAVSDSTATVVRREGLDARAIAAHKAAGGRIADLDGAEPLRTEVAVRVVDAAVVVDATPSSAAQAGSVRAVCDEALRRGGRIALASKAALCASVDAWLTDKLLPRVGVNAVLGGTGRAFVRELPELRRRVRGAALCGNATTALIVEHVEAGGTIAGGIAEAGARGLLEHDPELDLCGRDAAVKLAIVAGALRGAPVDPDEIAGLDVRALDEQVLRERSARGATTRLVGRYVADRGELVLAFEELPRSSPLVAPPDRVVYAYELDDGTERIHVGGGVGPRPTAEALWRDIVALGGAGGAA